MSDIKTAMSQTVGTEDLAVFSGPLIPLITADTAQNAWDKMRAPKSPDIAQIAWLQPTGDDPSGLAVKFSDGTGFYYP